jgi:hypothetical protein
MWSLIILLVIIFFAFRIAPREHQEDAHIHGAGQIGLLAALALFGVDYFTSYFYATGELMGALHPYGLQQYGYIAVAVIAIANVVFGALYMYSLGVFNEGGGSFAAAMRYLGPSLSLIVAVVLLQDYVFTIVVSTLSGVDQLLSVLRATGIEWIWHFFLGVGLVGVMWWLTIRGRSESARVTFIMLAIFGGLTAIMTAGLVMAWNTVPPAPSGGTPPPVSLMQAGYHMLTASMKGLVALSGLEAMSNGIQFVMNKDMPLIEWGKRRLPRLKSIWNFYSGKSGIGRMVQTTFLFYGGLTTFLLATFSIRFNVFDNTNGMTLVGNLAHIGFSQFAGFSIFGGPMLFWAYQLLAVGLLAAASMTAYQDIQAMAWRNVAIGEIPEIVVYRNPKGTFTRPVTAAAIAAIILIFLVQGKVTLAVPFYGVGVFMPIMAMGWSIRRHILATYTGRKKVWGAALATFASVLAGIVFIGQIVGKWEEGGWIVLISFSALVLIAHAILLSPLGYRDPKQIHRIIRDKSKVLGPMGNIVEWQSLRAQEYRYNILVWVSVFFEWFGVRRPVRYEKPMEAGEYDLVIHPDHLDAPSLLEQYLDAQPPEAPVVGGHPKETAGAEEE